METTRHEWTLTGLGCANCARKIEAEVRKMEGVASARLDFANSKIYLELDSDQDADGIRERVKTIISGIEPGCCINDTEASESDDRMHFRKRIAIYIAGLVIFIAAIILPGGSWPETLLFVTAWLIFGGQVIAKSFRNILKGRVFDENFLMTIATIGAFILGEYAEGASVMLFYQVGEMFQEYALDKSRRSIRRLLDIKPEYANIMTESGPVKVSPANVRPGDRIMVLPGERIPLDGRVLEGHSSVDTSPLTGESLPRDVQAGDEVLSGSINQSGVLTLEVTKSYENSTVSRILELVQNASGRKAVTERFITRFAAKYTPAVVGLAAMLAILPPLITSTPFSQWAYRALVFLVISCPCALVISIPLGFFGGIGAASRQGILVKGGNYLEALARTETMVFDKTGTLTTGVFQVTGIVPRPGFTGQEILHYAACAESYSTHPLARSVLERYGDNPDPARMDDHAEIPGKGVRARVDGKQVLCGNRKLMGDYGIAADEGASAGTSLYVAVDGVYAGRIDMEDTIKPDAASALESLQAMGIHDTVLLTGDVRETANEVAGRLGIGRVHSQLLPQDKVTVLESIIEEKKWSGPVVFVGDGINDAAVISRADIGIAMGGIGSDAAIEAADIVIMNDEVGKLCDAVSIARKTRRIVFQNIVLALGVKILFLIMATGGLATLWEAVFADVGVALLAVLNAMRVIKTGRSRR
ncbi:MAG TPA: heavy metal translocating P-type ATPase [Thermoclostridium sp.]|nr:heavy metal translocating P-type ATPase [Thermoclostridium sp.]